MHPFPEASGGAYSGQWIRAAKEGSSVGVTGDRGFNIDLVMKTKGVGFRHEVELLRADHPSLTAGDARVVRKGTTAKLEAPVKVDADDQEALRQVMAAMAVADTAKFNVQRLTRRVF